MKRFRKTKSRKMKSVEIELSKWVKFNEQNEQETIRVLNRKETEDQKQTDHQEKENQKEADNQKETIQYQKEKAESEKHSEESPVYSTAIRPLKVSEGIKKRERRKVTPKPEAAKSPEQNSSVRQDKEDGAWTTKRDYALVRKDRIRKASAELEQFKKEYRVLAEYHNDISRLQELPDGGTERIMDTAGEIIRLQNERKAFQEDMTRLEDTKYLQMSRYTEDMPDVIRRLTSDELYVSKLKKQIDDLEGDKGEQQYESKVVEESQGKMKNLSVAGMFVLLVLFGVLLVLQLYFQMDTQIYTLLCGIAFAVMTLAVFIRYFNNVNRAKKTEYQLNKIISRQNKVKIKYVNALNGVEYVYRRYQVHSASELLFQWEQYLMTKKARESYQRSGNEIIYYTQRLQRLLEQYRIQDPGMWMNQIDCLSDEQKMNALKKELENKVEDAKKKIDDCRKAIQKAKDDISLLAIRNPQYADAIRELTDTGEADVQIL